MKAIIQFNRHCIPSRSDTKYAFKFPRNKWYPHSMQMQNCTQQTKQLYSKKVGWLVDSG